MRNEQVADVVYDVAFFDEASQLALSEALSNWVQVAENSICPLEYVPVALA